ncbi:MAG: hypothetical protein Q8R12_02235 [bacterium]|nr:hypothetical protein [bacterium]
MLNLLPPEEKIMVGRERLRRFIVVFGVVGGAVLFLGVILMFPSYVALMFRRLDLTRELNLSRKAPLLSEVDQIEKSIKNFNQKLLLYEKGAKNLNPISKIEEQILKLRPSAISIRTLLYENASKTNPERISIKGRAQTRSELLRFQKNLESSGLFKTVHSPISNLLQEADLEFSLVLDLGTL